MGAREEFWSIYREALPVLFVALLGGLFSGVVLERIVERAGGIEGLLVMVPVFLATRGNVYGALGGRIASGIHQGLVAPRFEWNERLVNAVVASFVNGTGISVVIGGVTWAVLRLLPGWEPAALGHLVAIMFLAGVSTSVVLIFGLLALIFLGYEYGYDPDNLVGPIVTTLGDTFGMLFLFVAVVLFEVVV
jgi:mgtE-like transporter